MHLWKKFAVTGLVLVGLSVVGVSIYWAHLRPVRVNAAVYSQALTSYYIKTGGAAYVVEMAHTPFEQAAAMAYLDRAHAATAAKRAEVERALWRRYLGAGIRGGVAAQWELLKRDHAELAGGPDFQAFVANYVMQPAGSKLVHNP